MIQEARRKWGGNDSVWGIWNTAALYCQVGPFQSFEGERVSLVKREGSYLTLSFSKAMIHATWLPKNVFVYPVNIPNPCTEMLALIITACHKLASIVVLRGVKYMLREHHCQWWGFPLVVSMISFGKMQCRSLELPTALCASSPLGFPTTSTLGCLILYKVWGNSSHRKDWGQGEIMVFLIVTPWQIHFDNTDCHCRRLVCVILNCLLSSLSTIKTLPVRTDTSRLKGILLSITAALFSGDVN